ncbi:DUF4190 domain-containing protein [Kitasatospora aureofaciens]|uniref:DUF4190 domain-containing protein n=1 Tax=Kitasatospora aureofaciens TaxID=1894 RepID=UPI001C47F110|nr:DUF4190 domain-containing protein [Kitasatospora aureofaciens]MBV6701137.1 DUF4190 domain-containing protein [Kitasatospora aureofaciens]
MSKPDSDVPAPGPEAAEPTDRVDLRKSDAPATDRTEAAEATETTPEPADPWAAPGPAAPTADRVPPSAALPPPPPPGESVGGWASVPPGAYSGFQSGYPYPPASRETNGFAVGAMVTGLVCAWPVAFVLSIIALVQIGKRGERGRGMAVTGLVFGVIGLLLTGLGVLGGALASDGTDRTDRFGPAPKAPAGSVRWSSLKSGDCYNSPDSGSRTDPKGGDETLYWVRKVPCSAPHHGEVAGTARIPASDGPSYPGDTAIRARAAELCHPVLDEYALDQWAIPDGMDEVYLYPTRGNWKSGERYVTCAFEDPDGEHLGTVRTDRGSLNSAQLTYLEAVRGFNTAYANRPKGEADAAPSEYGAWARQMAAASRGEAEQLSKTSTVWPDGAKPKVAALVAAQREAAAAWDSAAKTTDATALAGEIRRAEQLTAKTTPLSVEVRSELGLSTGEQVPDIRV